MCQVKVFFLIRIFFSRYQSLEKVNIQTKYERYTRDHVNLSRNNCIGVLASAYESDAFSAAPCRRYIKGPEENSKPAVLVGRFERFLLHKFRE